MSKARTWLARIEERTLRIGFGIKCASEGEIGLPEPLAFQPALNGGEPVPLGPFGFNQLFRLNHSQRIADLRWVVNFGAFGDKFLRLRVQALFQRFVLGNPLLCRILPHVVGDFHRAELRAAHGTEMRQLGAFGR